MDSGDKNKRKAATLNPAKLGITIIYFSKTYFDLMQQRL